MQRLQKHEANILKSTRYIGSNYWAASRQMTDTWTDLSITPNMPLGVWIHSGHPQCSHGACCSALFGMPICHIRPLFLDHKRSYICTCPMFQCFWIFCLTYCGFLWVDCQQTLLIVTGTFACLLSDFSYHLMTSGNRTTWHEMQASWPRWDNGLGQSSMCRLSKWWKGVSRTWGIRSGQPAGLTSQGEWQEELGQRGKQLKQRKLPPESECQVNVYLFHLQWMVGLKLGDSIQSTASLPLPVGGPSKLHEDVGCCQCSDGRRVARQIMASASLMATWAASEGVHADRSWINRQHAAEQVLAPWHGCWPNICVLLTETVLWWGDHSSKGDFEGRRGEGCWYLGMTCLTDSTLEDNVAKKPCDHDSRLDSLELEGICYWWAHEEQVKKKDAFCHISTDK